MGIYKVATHCCSLTLICRLWHRLLIYTCIGDRAHFRVAFLLHVNEQRFSVTSGKFTFPLAA